MSEVQSVPPLPFLLTVKEVSLLLQIPRHKVYLMIETGAIVAVQLNAEYRVRKDSVEQLIPEGTTLQ